MTWLFVSFSSRSDKPCGSWHVASKIDICYGLSIQPKTFSLQRALSDRRKFVNTSQLAHSPKSFIFCAWTIAGGNAVAPILQNHRLCSCRCTRHRTSLKIIENVCHDVPFLCIAEVVGISV